LQQMNKAPNDNFQHEIDIREKKLLEIVSCKITRAIKQLLFQTP
jgi:hypothetical protein